MQWGLVSEIKNSEIPCIMKNVLSSVFEECYYFIGDHVPTLLHLWDNPCMADC
jgi:hypothetical protein